MAYTPTTWVDGTTPVNAANLNKIETGLDNVDALADVLNTRLTAEEALLDIPLPLVEDNWLKVQGGALVWAPMAGGGGGGLDWEGAYAGGTSYVKGDVVTYNGVTYGAVNDSLGQTPPAANQIPQTFVPTSLVTALPSSPFDGQEVILTDSLTAPTYTWRFRYVAAKASNKWVFVGGAPANDVVATTETRLAATYGALATAGPQLTVPVTGLYRVEFGCLFFAAGGWQAVMSVSIGGAPAQDADAVGVNESYSAEVVRFRGDRRSLTAAQTLVAQYHSDASHTATFRNRQMYLTPIAVGG